MPKPPGQKMGRPALMDLGEGDGINRDVTALGLLIGDRDERRTGPASSRSSPSSSDFDILRTLMSQANPEIPPSSMDVTVRRESRTMLRFGAAPLGEQPQSTRTTPRVAGRFSLGELLGKGSAGKVYRAYDHYLEEWVAMKILRGELLTVKEIRRLFRREIRAARRISHPNVIRLFEYGETGSREHPATASDSLWVTMELLEGGHLARWIAEEETDLTIELAIAEGMASGLAAIHDEGIIHRDIKPENILFNSRQTVKISDFGIARFQLDPKRTMGLMGTPAYASPEQIRGRPLGRASDLFSLGVVMYELFTRRHPHRDYEELSELLAATADDGEILEPSAYRPTIPQPLNDLIVSMIKKRPEERLSDAAEVALRIASIRDDL